jgi:hypothetical protein
MGTFRVVGRYSRLAIGPLKYSPDWLTYTYCCLDVGFIWIGADLTITILSYCYDAHPYVHLPRPHTYL